MIKKFIEPLQKVLIQKKMCPACTRPFAKAKVVEQKDDNTQIIACECQRLFVYDKDSDTYRRALQEEV